MAPLVTAAGALLLTLLLAVGVFVRLIFAASVEGSLTVALWWEDEVSVILIVVVTDDDVVGTLCTGELFWNLAGKNSADATEFGVNL